MIWLVASIESLLALIGILVSFWYIVRTHDAEDYDKAKEAKNMKYSFIYCPM